MSLQAGSRLGNYEIVAPLGSGGMGVVYRARDTKLERDVALKVLHTGEGDVQEQADRLLLEARTASALNHPNIATIYEVGEAPIDGRSVPYIAMELVVGPTLAHWTASGGHSVERVLEIASQIADALTVAHSKGIVHRDLKPSNLIVSESGRVKVLDFGLARVSRPSDENATTQSLWDRSSPAGTLSYMSPEQLRGHSIDSRSDIFSTGVVLFELLTGRLPFSGKTAIEVIDAILREDPPPVSRLAAGASPELSRIVRKMLEKNRDKRFQTMKEVFLDLEAAREEISRGRSSTPFSPVEGAPPSKPSVGVMTFSNITKDPSDDWLGTGIAETVSSDLKTIPDVTIIGRERISEVLRRLNPAETGEESFVEAGRLVGARWIVSGGFQRQGESLRITARFVDVSNGEALRTVKIDGAIGEIFSLQDKIVSELSRDLCLNLDQTAPAAAEDPDDTHVVEAFEAYSKGLINFRAASLETLDRAILLFERAVELDPRYLRASLALASAYLDKGEYLGREELVIQSFEAYRRAADSHPGSVDAWRGISSTLLALGRHEESLEAGRRAVTLDPGNFAVHATLGRVLLLGKADFEEAAGAYERSLSLNPQAGWSALQLAHCRALLSDFERGRVAALRAIELQEQLLSGKEGLFIIGAHTRMGHILALEGDFSGAIGEYHAELGYLRGIDHALKDRASIELYARLGSAEMRNGNRTSALEHLERATLAFEERLRLSADDPSTRYYAACAWAIRGEPARAVEHLEAAARVRPAFTCRRARIDPDFESLRGDPSFQSILQLWHDPAEP